MLLALTMVLPAHLMADLILIVNPHGAWILDQGANPPTFTQVVVDRISIDSSVGSPNPTPNPRPNPGPTPPLDAVTQQIAAASKTHLKTAQEARALIASIDMMRGLVTKGALKDEQLDPAISASLPVIAAQFNAGNRLRDWYAAVKAALGGTITSAGLIKASAGLASAWSIDAAKLNQQLGAAQAAVAGGAPVAQAAAAASDEQAEVFDIGMIMIILQAIMTLLTTLGII
jgi:hypothetical protein